MSTSEQVAARIDATPDPDKTHRAFLALASEYIDGIADPGWTCGYVARVFGDDALADMVLAMLAENAGTT